MTDYASLTLAEASEHLRRKAISPVEYLQARSFHSLEINRLQSILSMNKVEIMTSSCYSFTTAKEKISIDILWKRSLKREL